jgi:photosystem II stability/assembly factor-like uncharacterized protein
MFLRGVFVAVTAFSALIPGNSFGQNITWQETNGPHGGYVRDIAAPSQDKLYAVSNYRVFVSDDNGLNWSEGEVPSVLCVVVDSVGVAFCGTSFGIYRSSDQGQSWVISGLDWTEVNALAVRPNGNLLAGTVDYDHGNLAVYESLDGGGSWVDIGLGSVTILSFAFDSIGNIFAGGYPGIWKRSVNGGAWTQVGLDGRLVRTVEVLSNGFILAGTALNGAFRSTDEGSTWVEANDGLTDFEVWSIDSDANGKVYLGGGYGHIFESTNTGLSWNELIYWRFSGVHKVFVNPSQEVLAGTELAGLYRSTDQGVSWFQAGIEYARTDDMSVSPSGWLFLAGGVAGIFRSSDHGLTWAQANAGIRIASLNSVVVTLSGSVLAAGGYGNFPELYRSSDNGNNWALISDNTHADVFLVHPSGAIFMGSYALGVHRSTDDGLTWTPVNTGLDHRSPVAMTATPSGTTIVGTYQAAYRSTNNGDSWTSCFPDAAVISLAADTEGRLFAGTSAPGTYWIGTGLWVSLDQGLSWQQVGESFGDIPLVSLVTNSLGHIYAATDSAGVFMSSDHGTTWLEVNSGLEGSALCCVAMDEEEHVLAGTVQNGVYRTLESSVTTVRPLYGVNFTGPSLFFNYPNPFNSTTTISFSLPRSAETNLSIFNLLGEEVTTLVSGPLDAGTHTVQWNAANHPSGAYFYRLQTGDFLETRKLILTR